MTQQYPLRDNNRIVKSYFRSGTVLFRGILQILYIGLYIGLNLIIAGIGKDIIAIATDYDYSVVSAYDTGSVAALVSLFAAVIPLALIAVAYIMIYVKSRSESPDARPDGGITILNVFAIIELICTILLVIGGIAATVILFVSQIRRANSQSGVRYNYAPLILYCVSIALSCILILVYAIVYKRYIGSIGRTAKTDELRASGAKAYGVFTVLRAIGSAFGVIGAAALLIVNSRLPEWLAQVNADAAAVNVAAYLSSKGTVFFLLLVLTSVVIFVTQVVDARIAFGYSGHIRRAEAEQYSSSYNSGNHQSYGGYYPYSTDQGGNTPTDTAPRPRVRGYGDHFYDDDE